MASHTIVAVFDTHAHADLAIADLQAAGVPASAIQHYTEENTSGITTTTPDMTLSKGKPQGGMWAWLTGEDATDEHTTLYDRSIQNGNTVVTVIADDSQADRVASILESHAPINVEEHAPTGAYGATAGATHGGLAEAAGKIGEEVVSLAEETLEVGKRVVAAGTTRLRKYTVERPVVEQVRLRDETVNVFRRPVTGTTTVGADAFKDRTIEMTQTREEAVVGKSARVVEEVVLQKGQQERTETVRDTVRREEIEVTGPHDGTGNLVREGALR